VKTSQKRRTLMAAGAALAAGANPNWIRQAHATMASGDVRLLVPLTAGSSVDVIARSVSSGMAGPLHQNMIVDNRPGADSIIATQLEKNAKPDGRTLIMVTPAHAINVFLHADNIPYDAVRDFTLIGLTATNVNVCLVPLSSDIKSISDLIARAKSEPGRLNYGDCGGTSGGSAELFNYYAKVKTTDVLYRGAPEVVTDLLAGRLDVAFLAMSTAMPMVRAGKLRAIASTGATRHPVIPDIPAVAETLPGYEVLGWYALLGPRGMPDDVTTQINQALMQSIATPNVKKILAANGFDPASPNSPADCKKFIQTEIERWGKVTKPAGHT
jgi:tripartite-type tricarboxylate transporter receptor subunit TctC